MSGRTVLYFSLPLKVGLVKMLLADEASEFMLAIEDDVLVMKES